MWPLSSVHRELVIVKGDLLRFKNGNKYLVEAVILSTDHNTQYYFLSWLGNERVSVPVDEFERQKFFTRMKYQRDLWRAEQGLY